MNESSSASVTVPAALDGKDFLRFALFDTFRRKKRWKPPVLFACLMSAFALACFSLRGSRDQAVLLGGVLLGVGLLLPLVWFLFYLSSVRKEARRLGLSREQPRYETRLGESGVAMLRGEDRADWRWQDIHAAWRVRGCIYLYVRPEQALLLPEDRNADRAWEILCAHLPESKRKDLR